MTPTTAQTTAPTGHETRLYPPVARCRSTVRRHARSGPARLSGDEATRLVRSAAAGDHEAWAALVEEFSGLIAGIARAHRLGDADAADVAQATWMKLFERLGALNDPSRVAGWIATTARRECLHVLRHGQRVVALAPDAGEGEPVAAPDESLIVRERHAAVRQGFSRLAERDQMLLLHLLGSEPRRDYGEISARLGMPVGSIGPTRARALVRLRRELDEQGSLSLLEA